MKQKTSNSEYILIFDSSTLIVLHELNSLDLLGKIRESGIAKIIIPQSVNEEFVSAGIHIDIIDDSVLLEYENPYKTLHENIPPSLGKGEYGAITIAYDLSRAQSKKYTAIVVTDDLKARKTCEKIGLKVLGTLGLIIFAEKHGVITEEEAVNLLERIPGTSLYITPELLRESINKIKKHQ